MSVKKDLHIIHWNARSVKPKLIQLENFLHQRNVDIACISETWLRSKDKFRVNNFVCHRHDRENDAKGGGVLILVRNDICHHRINSINTKCIENIGINIDKIDLLIRSVYFNGNSANVQYFKHDIQNLTNTRKKFYICGDLNARHSNWNCLANNTAGNQLLKCSLKSDYNIHYPLDHTYVPTAKSKNPSTLDLILSNDPYRISQPSAVNNLGSDHLPVSFTIFRETARSAPTEIFNFSKANWKKFQANMGEKTKNLNNSYQPEQIKSTDDLNVLINKFQSSIIESRNVSVPKVIVKNSGYRNLPDNILKMIRWRNYSRRKWLSTRQDHYLQYMKMMNRMIAANVSKFRNEEWNKTLKEFTVTGSKQFWSVTKAIKNTYNSIPPIVSNGITHVTDTDKAEAIATGFNESYNLTINQNSTVENEVNSVVAEVSSNLINSDEIIKTDDTEVVGIIKRLRVKKSAGFDEINNRLIKQLPIASIRFLVLIFNLCMSFGFFPDAWKTAKVIAIPKPNKNKSDPKSYRPISLTACIGKIFERVILTRMNNFILDNEILNNEQFGFRAGCSTTHQVKRIDNMVKHQFRFKKSTGLVLLDIEKAFDSVWHNGLVYKLSKNGFPLYLIRAIQSFIFNRSFFVSIGKANSGTRNIFAGVPQGAVLSPTLFNLFIFDFPIPNRCGVALYADDAAVYCSHHMFSFLKTQLELGIQEIMNYYKIWKIKVNTSKTECIYFSLRKDKRRLPNGPLNINGELIHWSDKAKYLGVTLDPKLTFVKHINEAIRKATVFSVILTPLTRRSSDLNVKNKLLLYKAILRAVLTYAAPVWLNSTKTALRQVQIFQNKCLRRILKSEPRTRITALHDEANIPMIIDFIRSINEKFVDRCSLSTNPLINDLYD